VSETTETIGEWAEGTFGPVNPVDAAHRIMKEAVECAEATSQLVLHGLDAEEKVRLELADIIITCRRLAYTLGLDVDDAVNIKMAVNRQRKWRLDGRGGGQHV